MGVQSLKYLNEKAAVDEGDPCGERVRDVPGGKTEKLSRKGRYSSKFGRSAKSRSQGVDSIFVVNFRGYG